MTKSSSNLLANLQNLLSSVWPLTTKEDLNTVQALINARLNDSHLLSEEKILYQTFLTFLVNISDQFEENQPGSFYRLSLEYLSNNSFEELNQINPMVLVDIYYLFFESQLAGQKNPSAIIPFLSRYFDEPPAFCAIIIWLLNQGVTPDELINSKLLHQFFEYNYWRLGQEDCLNTQLYTLLAQVSNNDSVTQLVESAKNISCGNAALLKISLFGTLGKNDLEHRSYEPLSSSLTVDKPNLEKLHRCFFDIIFLEKLLIQTTDGDLVSYFNEPEILKQIPGLISHILENADEDKSESLLQTLSFLITEENIKKGLENHYSYLYLLINNSSKLSYFTTENTSSFISLIERQVQHSYEQTLHLMSFFELLNNNNNYCKQFLSFALLDNFIERAEILLNDDYFLNDLENFQIDRQIIREYRASIHRAHLDFIHKKTAVMITKENYAELLENNEILLKKIELLNNFEGIFSLSENPCPFPVTIIKLCQEQQGQHFDLQATLNAIVTMETAQECFNEKINILADVFFIADNILLSELALKEYMRCLTASNWARVFSTLLPVVVQEKHSPLLILLLNSPAYSEEKFKPNQMVDLLIQIYKKLHPSELIACLALSWDFKKLVDFYKLFKSKSLSFQQRLFEGFLNLITEKGDDFYAYESLQDALNPEGINNQRIKSEGDKLEREITEYISKLRAPFTHEQAQEIKQSWSHYLKQIEILSKLAPKFSYIKALNELNEINISKCELSNYMDSDCKPNLRFFSKTLSYEKNLDYQVEYNLTRPETL